MSKIVTATPQDSIRIEIPGTRAVQIPCEVILEVEIVEDDATQEQGWQASTDGCQDAIGDMAPTPWGAIVALGKKVGT